jgi:hypothetical protein
MTVETDDTDSAFIRLQRNSDTNATVEISVQDAGAGANNARVQIECDGGGIATLALQDNGGGGNGATLDARGGLSLFTDAGYSALDTWDQAGNVQRFGLLPTAGQPMIGVVAAPPDGDLAASQVSLWFDDTNGLAKLMVKGKSANGTVVTGSIPLV